VGFLVYRFVFYVYITYKTKMTRGTSKKVQDRIIENLNKNDAELISFEKGRRVKYRCSCGNETESDTSNIGKATWGGCAKCLNKRRGNKNDYEFARKVWEKEGEILPKQEYKGNKTKLYYTCSNCHQEAHMSLSEFNRGRRCEHCSKSRAKNTNLKRYGVENPFQSLEIKQRIKEQNIKKYGVDHHMKVPEILQKAIDTNIKKYGLSFAFHSDKSFDKIRATCIDRYGVPFPLQNKHIREKVVKSCREKFGVDYPLQSEEIQDKIMKTFQEKYGMDKYEYLHQHIENVMMEKFGVKCAFQVEEYREKSRQTCLKRYGVEYQHSVPKSFIKWRCQGIPVKNMCFQAEELSIARVMNHGVSTICLKFTMKTIL